MVISDALYDVNESEIINGIFIVPDEVSFIGNYACNSLDNLEKVIIPDSVLAIGHAAFHACKNLKTVVMSKNLRTLCRGAFSDCVSLSSISLPSTVEYTSLFVFENCLKLKEKQQEYFSKTHKLIAVSRFAEKSRIFDNVYDIFNFCWGKVGEDYLVGLCEKTKTGVSLRKIFKPNEFFSLFDTEAVFPSNQS